MSLVDEVMANVDVLGVSMGYGVAGQGDTTLIVSVDGGCLGLRVSEVLK